MQDLLIIGGGPAGISAAIYAARKKLDTTLLTRDLGGQINLTLAIPDYRYQIVEGMDVLRRFEEEMQRFPLQQQVGEEARRLSRKDSGFEVTTESGAAIQAKAVVIATGKRPRQLNVPGEERLVARGVSYCATCDGPLFADMRVAIIGGSGSALSAADEMTRIASHVYLVSSGELSGDPVLISRLKAAKNITILTGHEVTEIKGQQMVEALRLREYKSDRETEMKVSGIIIEIGMEPASGLARGLVAINERGEIIIDCNNATSVPGILAAGDVTNVAEKQLVIALGEGAKAALQASRYLQHLPG